MANPQICTWDNEADCSAYPNQTTLHCKGDGKALLGFHCIAWPFLVVGIFGLVLTGIVAGAWWLLVGYELE